MLEDNNKQVIECSCDFPYHQVFFEHDEDENTASLCFPVFIGNNVTENLTYWIYCKNIESNTILKTLVFFTRKIDKVINIFINIFNIFKIDTLTVDMVFKSKEDVLKFKEYTNIVNFKNLELISNVLENNSDILEDEIHSYYYEFYNPSIVRKLGIANILELLWNGNIEGMCLLDKYSVVLIKNKYKYLHLNKLGKEE